MNDQLNGLVNNAAFDSAVQQQNTKEHIRSMMDKEHSDMLKLAETQERSKDLLKDAQNNLVASKELFNDKLQQTKDKIAQERQNAQDRNEISRQRVEDQMQRLRDQQNR